MYPMKTFSALALAIGLALSAFASAQDASAPAASAPAAPANSYDPATADSEVKPEVKFVTQSLFTDIVQTETATIAIGERGHIVKSTDLKSWTQLPVPTRSLLTNVFALGANLWAVGHEEVILHSADGGSTWARQHVNVEAFGPLLDVMFFDEKRGVAIGAEGKMMSTEDGGTTWADGSIVDRLPGGLNPAAAAQEEDDSGLASDDIGVDETPPHLNAIARNSAGLVIVGETGAAFSSTDEGKTWKRLSFPYNGPLFGIITLDDQSMIAYGLNGHAFQTRDLGANWTKLETETDSALMGGLAVNGGRAVLVGSRGAFLTKAPDSDRMKLFNFSDAGAMAGVVQGANGEFIVIGENGILPFSPK
jgi:photosystem II stability/assembly factor-like uncharacterized protein